MHRILYARKPNGERKAEIRREQGVLAKGVLVRCQCEASVTACWSGHACQGARLLGRASRGMRVRKGTGDTEETALCGGEAVMVIMKKKAYDVWHDGRSFAVAALGIVPRSSAGPRRLGVAHLDSESGCREGVELTSGEGQSRVKEQWPWQSCDGCGSNC